ncbi:hypothetical protein EDD16DRAFT_1732760 [Pisolithus croceorrhizus]|nr:hypothetical protein EDD16DRAFT_1732760 [Pisolithus croceorrhizus]
MLNRAKLEAFLALISLAAQQAMVLYEQVDGKVLDQVELKAAVRMLEGACAQLCTTLAPPRHTAMNASRFFYPDPLYDYSCVRLAFWENITNILMDYSKGLHVNEIFKKNRCRLQKLSRIMRPLAARGCYSEGCVCEYTVVSVPHSENSISHMVNLHTESVSKGAALIYENLKGPRTAYSYHPDHYPVMVANNKEGTTGVFFDWLRQKDSTREVTALLNADSPHAHNDEVELPSFNARSCRYHEFFRCPHSVPLNKYSTVVDVGGGIGTFSLPLAKVHKHVKITVHDLPEAPIQARSVRQKSALKLSKKVGRSPLN